MSSVIAQLIPSPPSGFDFENRTHLEDARLRSMLLNAIDGWPLGPASIRVRYSRGADFSGRCLYRDERIYVNLGPHLSYPYRLQTYLGKAVSGPRGWHRPIYYLELANAYELVLFVFLHEWFHLLIKRAKRNPRQKESMCDRFAARLLVDRYGAKVCESDGRPVAREAWDFQDLDGFVALARGLKQRRQPAATSSVKKPKLLGLFRQLFLFET